MTTVETPRGTIQLTPAPDELIGRMEALLPFGLVRLAVPQRGAEYGIVMQRGEKELMAIKQQPPDFEESVAIEVFKINSVLIALSLKTYLQNHFAGLLIPCAYLRQKPNGLIEPGIAYFIYPSAARREVQELAPEPAYDGEFGRGFTSMMAAFIQALRESAARTELPLQLCIGLEPRPRLKLGKLAFGLAALGESLVCLKRAISEEDPVWEALRVTGCEEVVHLPSVPVAL